MVRTIEGVFDARNRAWVIVASRWNSFITERLVEGAIDTLVRHGADSDDITLVRAPGGFELPLVVKRVAASGRYDAVLAIGCVIRGATPHFDYVSSEATKGIAHASMDTGVPVGLGVLTTDTIEQAIERAGTKAGNKGTEAAMAAIEMVNLLSAVDADQAG